MSPAPNHPKSAFSDYEVEISTEQCVPLDSTIGEFDANFMKYLGVRVLHCINDMGETEVVGQGAGHIFLASAGNMGVELRDILDDLDGDLVYMYDELLEAGVELPTWEDILVLTDLDIAPTHWTPGIEMAVFRVLIATRDEEMNVAVATTSALGPTQRGLQELPADMTWVKGTEYVVWNGERMAR